MVILSPAHWPLNPSSHPAITWWWCFTFLEILDDKQCQTWLWQFSYSPIKLQVSWSSCEICYWGLHLIISTQTRQWYLPLTENKVGFSLVKGVASAQKPWSVLASSVNIKGHFQEVKKRKTQTTNYLPHNRVLMPEIIFVTSITSSASVKKIGPGKIVQE